MSLATASSPWGVWSFLVASLVMAAIPGPDQALITRNALAGGRRAGIATMLGGASGIGVHATAAAFGLSAILAASASAFTAVKLVGVAYLLYLAVATWRQARKVTEAGLSPSERNGGRLRTFARQGLLSNALNPKVALFFLTFLPQFLPAHANPAVALVFAALFAATYVSWFTLYVALVDRIAASLRRRRVRQTVERATAAFLATFALRLALERS
jgi:threonine/homoserine/homoserine lactone efflux protein